MATSPSPSQKPIATKIQITALDGITNVNSLFTLAVFLGLTWNPYDSTTTLLPPSSATAACSSASISAVAESMVSFHVYSFSSFLFSSLVALALKQAIRLSDASDHRHMYVNRSGARLGMLASAVGSVLGCGFLMLALIDVVQIKLGVLACGSSYSFAAVVPLVILVPSALLFYVCCVLYAFTR